MKAVYQLLLCVSVWSAQARAQVPVAAGISPAISAGAVYSYVNLSGPASTRIWLNGADGSATADWVSGEHPHALLLNLGGLQLLVRAHIQDLPNQ
jgi:hypothetical protein